MIIFLYGEDEFRSSRKLAEIKNKFIEKNKEGGTLFVFDFAESGADAGEMVLKISSGGLFSSKRLAIVKNILGNKVAVESKELLNFLKKEGLKDVTIVFWEKEKIDKKLKLAKFLFEKSKKQEFVFLDGAKISSWIAGEIWEKSAGTVSIGPKMAEKMSIFVGSNLMLLSREIEKIVNYKNKGEISKEDIELLVKSKVDTDIFKTIDAMARGDKKMAMELLHDHLDAGEDPFYLLSMYFFQFRNLLKVKPLAEKNISQFEIASKLKIHPFVAKKSAEQGRNFSLEKLKELYSDLCQIDFESKSGKVEIGMALDKFVSGA